MTQKVIPLAGLILFLVVASHVLGEASIAMNVESGILVLGGSLMSVLLAFPPKRVRALLKGLPLLFQHREMDREALIRQMESLARVGRMQGNRALDEAGDKLENSFLRKGIELVADGYDRFDIRNIMEKEYEIYFSQKDSQANILNTLARLAPVLGFMGTVLGLIKILGHMGDPTAIGKGMALALLTTFYGLLFANFLFLPLAKKHAEQTKDEATVLNIILEGVMDIADLKNAKAISHRLHSYLDASEMSRAAPTDLPQKSKDQVTPLRLQESTGRR
jgi:chemotaxis protein MotA